MGMSHLHALFASHSSQLHPSLPCVEPARYSRAQTQALERPYTLMLHALAWKRGTLAASYQRSSGSISGVRGVIDPHVGTSRPVGVIA
eukprot:5742264-Prymnesium_polylepis.1